MKKWNEVVMLWGLNELPFSGSAGQTTRDLISQKALCYWEKNIKKEDKIICEYCRTGTIKPADLIFLCNKLDTKKNVEQGSTKIDVEKVELILKKVKKEIERGERKKNNQLNFIRKNKNFHSTNLLSPVSPEIADFWSKKIIKEYKDKTHDLTPEPSGNNSLQEWINYNEKFEKAVILKYKRMLSRISPLFVYSPFTLLRHNYFSYRKKILSKDIIRSSKESYPNREMSSETDEKLKNYLDRLPSQQRRFMENIIEKSLKHKELSDKEIKQAEQIRKKYIKPQERQIAPKKHKIYPYKRHKDFYLLMNSNGLFTARDIINQWNISRSAIYNWIKQRKLELTFSCPYGKFYKKEGIEKTIQFKGKHKKHETNKKRENRMKWVRKISKLTQMSFKTVNRKYIYQLKKKLNMPKDYFYTEVPSRDAVKRLLKLDGKQF